MTTAHRPTWNPARGGETQGGFRVVAPTAKYSSRDMPAHLKMKLRNIGQDAPAEVSKRDLKKELAEREAEHYKKIGRPMDESEVEAVEEELKMPPEQLMYKDVDADVDLDDDGSERDEGDGNGDGASGGDAASDGEEDSDEDDDDAELLRELERIKKEREEERLNKEQEEREFQERQRAEAAARGNPLLNASQSSDQGSEVEFRVKRRWDEDVIFRNQARNERPVKPRFINDTIRNDFHRRFLAKYIR